MPSPADLNAARERKAMEEHLAVYGAPRADAERLFKHFVSVDGTTSESAAILTFAVMLAVPEGEPYE